MERRQVGEDSGDARLRGSQTGACEDEAGVGFTARGPRRRRGQRWRQRGRRRGGGDLEERRWEAERTGVFIDAWAFTV